jgi:membrane-bound lytic murein transglycosylase MltF
LRKRYYGDDKMVRRAYAPEDMQRFNELVGYFRRYGDKYGFDYLMITAQGYQESALKQSERSKSGAVGIMQMKPSSAREPDIAIEGIEKSAERKAQAMGLDRNVWFGNVENGAAAIVGRETVQYVSNVYKYYIAYKLVTREMDATEAARKSHHQINAE